MSDSTQTVPGEADTSQAYEAVTLRLARERVTDDRPLREVLKEVTEIASTALRVKRVSVWFFVDEPRSIRCDYLYQLDRGEIYEGAILHACDFPVYFTMLESSRVVSIRRPGRRSDVGGVPDLVPGATRYHGDARRTDSSMWRHHRHCLP